MRDIKEMQPMNATERFLYEMIVRQNIIIEQLSSIVEHIGKKDDVAVQSNKVQSISDVIAPVVDKEVEKELAELEKEDKPKRAPRKRTSKEG